MSAFIVSPETINRVVTFCRQNNGSRHYHAIDRLLEEALGTFARKYYEPDECKELSCQELASALYLLNCEAVDARYGKGQAAKDEAEQPVFQYKPESASDFHKVYKSAQCLRYQCSEGDIPEKPLYKFLEALINHIADVIVRADKRYDVAPWE